jgi:hypothetical protein
VKAEYFDSLSNIVGYTMKEATSESPQSVTGRSPRIKFPPIARKDDADLSRAEQIAAMKEYAMYQRIMSQRAPDAAFLPPPAWPKLKGLNAREQPNAVASELCATNDVELNGLFEMDL